jgi:hypothetical protein
MLWPLIVTFNGGYYYIVRINGDAILGLSDEEILSLSITILIASDFILLTNVQQDLRMVDQQEPISNFGICARLKWGAQLLVSGRGVGWAHEPPSVLPPHPTLTRVQFVVSRLRWLIAYGLMLDAVSISFLKDFLPSDERMDLVWKLWAIPIVAISVWLSMTISHLVCSIICVGTGLSEPAVWPHLFGNWSDAYTLRRFWGYENYTFVILMVLTPSLLRRTWHQLFRRVSFH